MTNKVTLYPQYKNKSECIAEAKRHLPITTTNELLWLIKVLENCKD